MLQVHQSRESDQDVDYIVVEAACAMWSSFLVNVVRMGMV